MQVMNLQAQLASLKHQAAQAMVNGSSNQNPNDRLCCKPASNCNYPQDVHSWLQSEYPNMVPPFDPSLNSSPESSTFYRDHHGGFVNHNHTSSMNRDDQEHVSFATFEGSPNYSLQSMASLELETNSKWAYQDSNDLRSMAFGYPQPSSI